MKIGLPKLRLSRKLLIITLGITVLLGGTSAAALYFKSADLGLESAENKIGGECTDVQTMVLKTPSNRLWLRRFIRMENSSGPDRVRTALRVAGLLAKKNAVDLIHVSVLDSHGPTLRSQMRARSIGAEVLIAMKPDNLPEMKSPAMASYYEGPVSDEGRYYGDKVVVDIDEIGAMMTAMRSVEEKPDCVSPEKAEDAEAKPNDHGKKDAKSNDHGKKEEHGTKPSEDHGEKPAEDHGEQKAEDHGEDPAKEGAEDHSNAEAPPEEQSFFDSMLSMVGLGGSEEKPAEDHAPTTDNSHAVAEEPADAASEGHEPAAKSDGHDAAEKPADAAAETDKAAADHDAKPGNHGDQAEGHKPVDDEEGHDAAVKPADESGDKVATEHAPKPEDHRNQAEAESHEPAAKVESHDAAEKPASNHGAVEGTKPATEAHDAEKTTADHAETGDKADAPPPADDDDHAADEKPKVDQHAEASMPVGD